MPNRSEEDAMPDIDAIIDEIKEKLDLLRTVHEVRGSAVFSFPDGRSSVVDGKVEYRHQYQGRAGVLFHRH